jgi:hypothetical protein
MCRIRPEPKSITVKTALHASGAATIDAGCASIEKQKIQNMPAAKKEKKPKRQKNKTLWF